MNWHKLQMILCGALIFTVLQSCVFNDDFGRKEEKTSDLIKEEEKKASENRDAKYFIGEICLIQNSLGFVLIKSSKVTPGKGVILHAIGKGELTSKAKLSLSPERRPGFIVADIIEGQPALGDWVFYNLESPHSETDIQNSSDHPIPNRLNGLRNDSSPENHESSKLLND